MYPERNVKPFSASSAKASLQDFSRFKMLVFIKSDLFGQIKKISWHIAGLPSACPTQPAPCSISWIHHYPPNNTLMEMILDETEGFFSGSLSAHETASAVAARLELYLAEQAGPA